MGDVSQQTMKKIEKAIAFDRFAMTEMSRSFPIVAQGFSEAVSKSRRPDIESVGAEAGTLLSGALIVYLFAMWDEFFEHADIQKYFRSEEQLRYFAFKHLRIVFAHNVNGERKGNRPDQIRLDHADKLDQVMAGDRPIRGVMATKDRVALKFPDAFLECQDFLACMARKLAAGRISIEGAYGKVRKAGGGEADVM